MDAETEMKNAHNDLTWTDFWLQYSQKSAVEMTRLIDAYAWQIE